jgi:hydrogenase maturation protein HypF
VLGVRDRVSYEGQAAIELEQLAGFAEAEPWRWRFGSTTALVALVADELAAGRARAEIAAAFHETIAASAAAEAYALADGCDTVVLSGGSFQNRRLAASTRARLEAYGFRVLEHRLVPPNDGGISYGQAAVAARRLACA